LFWYDVLGFSIYNITFTGILVVCTISLVELDRSSQTVLVAIGIWWGSFFSSVSFVVPRLVQVQVDRKSALLRESLHSSLQNHSIKLGIKLDDDTKTAPVESNNYIESELNNSTKLDVIMECNEDHVSDSPTTAKKAFVVAHLDQYCTGPPQFVDFLSSKDLSLDNINEECHK
jgi:hypothetical protein